MNRDKDNIIYKGVNSLFGHLGPVAVHVVPYKCNDARPGSYHPKEVLHMEGDDPLQHSEHKKKCINAHHAAQTTVTHHIIPIITIPIPITLKYATHHIISTLCIMHHPHKVCHTSHYLHTMHHSHKVCHTSHYLHTMHHSHKVGHTSHYLHTMHHPHKVGHTSHYLHTMHHASPP